MKSTIYQIQIALKGSKPKIWRRIQIPADLLLSDFHKILQTTMGWMNAHLHHFIQGDAFYTQKMADDPFWHDINNIDYKSVKVLDLLKMERQKIIYEYDFGDGWEHEIILEKILPVDDGIDYPICLEGKMNCPPEDCGGVWGYANMIDILAQPEHEEFNHYLEWVGKEFDPGYFDSAVVNQMLKGKDYGYLIAF
ncbi:MAG: plasmid pRiA4b ORF-3 family protein [Proteobacteria bacterium]|nr:plasmid pRiA4b ORF-3 family protein [Pseudomonadota bacterium]